MLHASAPLIECAPGIPSRDPHHGRALPSDQLRDLTLGTARRDCVACQGHRVQSDVHRPARQARVVSGDFSPRQGAGAVGRRQAAVRIECNRRVSRRDGASEAPSRRPVQARSKPGVDRLRARFLGGHRRRVLRCRRESARKGNGRCARKARKARGSDRPGAGATAGRTSTARNCLSSTLPTRHSCSATPWSRRGSGAGC